MEVVTDLLPDYVHLQVLSVDLLLVEDEPDDPGREFPVLGGLLHLEVGHEVVQLEKFLIVLDDGSLGVWVVEYLRGPDHMAECGVLNLAHELLCDFLILAVLFLQVDLQAGSLDVLCHIDDLLQAGNSEGHVFRGDASIVEGVQGHLGGWLTKGLCGYGAHHLTWIHDGLLKAGLDLTDDPIEGLSRQALSLDHVLGAEHRTQVDLKKPGRVLLGLEGQWVSADIDARYGRKVFK